MYLIKKRTSHLPEAACSPFSYRAQDTGYPDR